MEDLRTWYPASKLIGVDGKLVTVDGKAVAMWRRKEGAWKCVIDIWNDPSPPPQCSQPRCLLRHSSRGRSGPSFAKASEGSLGLGGRWAASRGELGVWSLLFSAFLLLGLCSVIGLADAPLRAPSPVTVCSNSKIFCLLTDPKTGTHAYRVRPDGSRQPLWSMPGWYRVIFLADDGRHAVTGYDGALLPLDYSPDEPLLTFWRDGSRIRAFPLSSLVKDLRKLQRTSSHYRWGSYVGFNAAGNLVVSTVERESVAFDVTTGKEAGR